MPVPPGQVEVPRLIEVPAASLPSPLALQLPERRACGCFVLGSSAALVTCTEGAPPVFVECHDFKDFSNEGCKIEVIKHSG